MTETSNVAIAQQKAEILDVVQGLTLEDRAVLVVIKKDTETQDNLILKDHHAGDLYDVMGLLQGGIAYAQHELALQNAE